MTTYQKNSVVFLFALAFSILAFIIVAIFEHIWQHRWPSPMSTMLACAVVGCFLGYAIVRAGVKRIPAKTFICYYGRKIDEFESETWFWSQLYWFLTCHGKADILSYESRHAHTGFVSGEDPKFSFDVEMVRLGSPEAVIEWMKLVKKLKWYSDTAVSFDEFVDKVGREFHKRCGLNIASLKNPSDPAEQDKYRSMLEAFLEHLLGKQTCVQLDVGCRFDLYPSSLLRGE